MDLDIHKESHIWLYFELKNLSGVNLKVYYYILKNNIMNIII